MSDEVTKKIYKIITNLNKAKIALKSIMQLCNINLKSAYKDKYTIIAIDELERLKTIEKRFEKIKEVAENTYRHLKEDV